MHLITFGMMISLLSMACATMSGCGGASQSPVEKALEQPKLTSPKDFAEALRQALIRKDNDQIDRLLPPSIAFSRLEHHGEGQRGPATAYDVPREKAMPEILDRFSHAGITARTYDEGDRQFAELEGKSKEKFWIYRLRVEIERSDSGQWRSKSVLLLAQSTATK